jgi:heme/copper-type cytochrome/quinol oxidase subunit 2
MPAAPPMQTVQVQQKPEDETTTNKLSTFQIVMIALLAFVVFILLVVGLYFIFKRNTNNASVAPSYGGKKIKALKKFNMKGGCGCSAAGIF